MSKERDESWDVEILWPPPGVSPEFDSVLKAAADIIRDVDAKHVHDEAYCEKMLAAFRESRVAVKH